MIELKHYFIASFVNLPKLFSVKKIKAWKFVVYGLFLTFFYCIPINNKILQSSFEMASEFHEIASSMPNFEVKDGCVTPQPPQTYVKETQHLGFIFEKSDKDQKEESKVIIPSSMNGKIIFILKQQTLEISFAKLSDKNQDANETPIVYHFGTTSGGLNRKEIASVFERLQTTSMIPITCIVLSYLISILGFTTDVLIMVLVSFFFLRKLQTGLKFMDRAKIFAFSLTAPVILISILSFYIPSLQSDFILIGTGCVLYFHIVGKNKQFEGVD